MAAFRAAVPGNAASMSDYEEQYRGKPDAESSPPSTGPGRGEPTGETLPDGSPTIGEAREQGLGDWSDREADEDEEEPIHDA